MAKNKKQKESGRLAAFNSKEFKEKLEEYLFQLLIDNGLPGYYSSNITKLILSLNYGTNNKIKTTMNESITSKFDEKQISRIAERILASRRGSNGNSSGEKKSN